MSSEHRSSSGVRNLLAVFESHESNANSPDRGRSPSGSDVSGRRNNISPAVGNRNVKASFVSVERSGQQLDAARRDSEAQDKLVTDTLQRTMSGGMDRKEGVLMPGMSAGEGTNLTSQAPVPESSFDTTVTQPMPLPTHELQSEHTEKLTSAIADEAAELRPADAKDASALSGGDGLAGKRDNLKKQANGSATAKTNGASKPTIASAKTTKPTRLSLSKSSAAPTSKTSSSTTPKSSTQKLPARTSMGPTKTTAEKIAELAKPAANRVAKPATTTSSHASPPSKSGRRSPTKPVALPSHLTAPTASFAAKHEAEPTKSSKPATAVSSRPMPSHLLAPTASSAAKHDVDAPASSSSKPAAKAPIRDRSSAVGSSGPRQASTRTSLASRPSLPAGSSKRTEPRTSTGPTAQKAAPSEGFLARMSKPTSASTNKTHGKSEVQSPTEATSSRSRASSTKAKGVNGGSKPTKTRQSDEQSRATETSITDANVAHNEPEPASEPVAPSETPVVTREPELPPPVSDVAEPASSVTPAKESQAQPLESNEEPAIPPTVPASAVAVGVSEADQPLPSIEPEEPLIAAKENISDPIPAETPPKVSEPSLSVETPIKREHNGSPLGMPNSAADPARMEETPQFDGASIR